MSTSRLNWGPPGFRRESSQSTVTCGCCAKAGELLLYYFSPMVSYTYGYIHVAISVLVFE